MLFVYKVYPPEIPERIIYPEGSFLYYTNLMPLHTRIEFKYRKIWSFKWEEDYFTLNENEPEEYSKSEIREFVIKIIKEKEIKKVKRNKILKKFNIKGIINI